MGFVRRSLVIGILFEVYSMLTKRNDGTGGIELVISLVVIALLISGIVIFLHKAGAEAKEITLKSQLQTLRDAIKYFKLVKGRYPDSVGELVSVEYKSGIDSSELFDKSLIGKNYLTDPFGSNFHYNKRSGVIYSQTKGYEEW